MKMKTKILSLITHFICQNKC